MNRTAFRSAAGDLEGWVAGEGPPVLLLHGGPGLSYEYTDAMADELLSAFRVASFQQRGLQPSTEDGPFTLSQAVADVEAVLDALAWESAYLVGHSWGGHLALHAAVSVPSRILGVLAVDPLGAVGDGGGALFGAELRARLSSDEDRARVDALEEIADSEDAALEQLGILWPSYFAVPKQAPPMPAVRLSVAANNELWPEIAGALPSLEAALPGITVPVGLLVGARSPMPPQEAGVATAERIPGAWVEQVADAGHFPWVEQPGCLLTAMNRLARP